MPWEETEIPDSITIKEAVKVRPVAAFTDGHNKHYLVKDINDVTGDWGFVLYLQFPRGIVEKMHWWPQIAIKKAAELIREVS